MNTLNERGAYLTVIHPDGRVVDVLPLTFGRALLGISPDADDVGYSDQWDFDTIDAAYNQAMTWAAAPGTEPDGWSRHPGTRRYRPGGDPSREYVKE